jgi:pimeloyl-ACP methyl ester carboxylesterase
MQQTPSTPSFAQSNLKLLFIAFFSLLLAACKKDGPQPDSEWQGSGMALFSDYEPQADKQIRLFYYVPKAATASTPIVFVFHGAERNAMDYRNAIVNKADSYGFIAVVPEFSEAQFPGVSAYQIGNVYQNGDQPSPATLLPESQWSLSLVEPMFAYVKNKTKNNTAHYHFIGHSAGAQFVHRFLLFKPDAKYARGVVSAAGWYTATDAAVDFPYGLQASPLENAALGPLFAKNICVQVGSADNNPNASSLRRDALSDAQGLHRLARAQYFYNKAGAYADSLGVPFTWQLKIIAGLNHNSAAAVGHAADWLFQ